MRIKTGTSRCVFLTNNWAIKVPIVGVGRACKGLIESLKYEGIEGFKNWFTRTEGFPGSFKETLFRGFIQNRREAKASDYFKELVIPTRLSIPSGFANFQDISEGVSIDEDGLLQVLEEFIGDDIYQDGHTFNNPENFGIHEGKVKLRDYGGRKTVSLLDAHRNAFQNAFCAMISMTSETPTIREEAEEVAIYKAEHAIPPAIQERLSSFLDKYERTEKASK